MGRRNGRGHDRHHAGRLRDGHWPRAAYRQARPRRHAVGAGLGAAGGAIADGGDGAGKGALIGGLAGAAAGPGYGTYKTRTECGTIFGRNGVSTVAIAR